MIRAVIAVVVGYVAWSGLWIGGSALFFTEASRMVERGEPFTQTRPLLGALGQSVLCLIVAGAIAGRIARRKARGASGVLGALLLLTGIAVQASVWSLEPLWYHLAFLVLLVPATLVGAWIPGRWRAPASP